MDDAAKKIIRDLARNRSKNTIIREISETYKLDRTAAENLVKTIESDNARVIFRKQRPLYLLLYSLMAACGLILSPVVIHFFLQERMISLFQIPIPYFGNVVFLLLGILALFDGLKNLIRILFCQQQGSGSQL